MGSERQLDNVSILDTAENQPAQPLSLNALHLTVLFNEFDRTCCAFRMQLVLMLSGAGISTGATALRDIQQTLQMLQVAFMISAILSMRLSS